MAAIELAVAFGLAGGYLDLVFIVSRKWISGEQRGFWNGRDFPWSVPMAHAALLILPSLILAAMIRLRPKPVSLRFAVWLFATLAIWSALLRLPLYGASSLLLASGIGRLIDGVGAAFFRDRRRVWYTALILLGMLIPAAALSTGRQELRRRAVEAALPPPPSNARNVLMIVWDTVRARNLSLYGYPRSTTPNLEQFARSGVRYDLALAPAPWTLPSHTCFFTGEWPFQTNTQWKFTLDERVPTLAKYLASYGYQTAGFSANTYYCSYETGLDRGFTHFEDFPLTLQSWIGRTVAGSWILTNLVHRDDYHAAKWIRFQSRDAGRINDAFLDWMRHRRTDRPFFAFLNFFDAHDPYVPPPGYVGRFGIRPQAPRDYRFLLDNYGPGERDIQVRDIWLARDCYDDCIAFLDDQLGRLLAELQGQGVLENTLVIVTSDHGESFGDHGVFVHRTSLYLDEIHVPLVIVAPDAPAGRVVSDPVSLRDLPATVVDRLGLGAGAPFPGRSLAERWSTAPGQALPASPALSELVTEDAFRPHLKSDPPGRGFQISLVASGRHYISDGSGAEQLYDLGNDSVESMNLLDSARGKAQVGVVRRLLLDVLSDNPGSPEVENGYLKAYKERLRSLVGESTGPRNSISSRTESAKDPPARPGSGR